MRLAETTVRRPACLGLSELGGKTREAVLFKNIQNLSGNFMTLAFILRIRKSHWSVLSIGVTKTSSLNKSSQRLLWSELLHLP